MIIIKVWTCCCLALSLFLSEFAKFFSAVRVFWLSRNWKRATVEMLLLQASTSKSTMYLLIVQRANTAPKVDYAVLFLFIVKYVRHAVAFLFCSFMNEGEGNNVFIFDFSNVIHFLINLGC